MTAIRDYLRQIAGYLIFISVSRKILLQKKYGPSIQHF